MAKPALHLSRHSPAWLTLGPLALGLLLIAALWLPALLAVVAEQDSGLPGRRREHLFLLSLLATALVVVAIGGFIRWAHRRHDDLQRRLRDITNNIPALIGHFDAQERCQFANDPALRWHGIRREELAQHSLRSALGEENYDHHLPYLRKVLQGETVQFEGKVQRKGADVYYQAHLVPEQLEGPDAPRGFYLMTFDVTALKQAELRQRTSEQRLRGIADNLPVLITCVDRNQCVEFANETNREWLGLAPEAIAGKPMREIWSPEIYALRRPFLERALNGERVQFQAERNALGMTRSLLTSYIPDVAEDGRIRGVYMLSADVSELKAVERQLSTLARVDSLTGLANRRQFDEKLSEALARAMRSGEALALLFIDIDHFKQINDNHGHAAGDEVLKEFARRLRQCVRATDTVARLAGDEFVVLLERIHSAAEPERVAGKIVAQMRIPIMLGEHALQVTTSIGVAFCPTAAAGADALLAQADAALYAAKAAGRDTYRLAASG